MGLKDVTLLCDKCQSEVALLKTVTYESDDSHRAKCVFGHLRRIELDAAVKDIDGHFSDPDNKEFLNMYLEIFDEMKE
jgi:hypothetical protein